MYKWQKITQINILAYEFSNRQIIDLQLIGKLQVSKVAAFCFYVEGNILKFFLAMSRNSSPNMFAHSVWRVFLGQVFFSQVLCCLYFDYAV